MRIENWGLGILDLILMISNTYNYITKATNFKKASKFKILAALSLMFLVLITQKAYSQGDYYMGNSRYPFINYDSNRIDFMGEVNPLDTIFRQMNDIMLTGEGKINIVHFGGSHIQADLYTHIMRKRLQTFQHGMNGGRGFVFPVRMAHTNNPLNFYVTYSGSWSYCKCTSNKYVCDLGISGMQVKTSATTGTISIMPNIDTSNFYHFSTVEVYHNDCNYKVEVQTKTESYTGYFDTLKGATIISIPYDLSKLKLHIYRDTSLVAPFELYGINLKNGESGIVYHSLGINGAMLKHFLKCNLYEKQMTALDPDLVIFSIGTNDAYGRSFNKELFYERYSELIEKTLRAAPNTKIMITVPNDSYLYRRYPNKNTAIMRDAIYSLAKKYDATVWDFYTIMGGFNSSLLWYRYHIMRYDRIHFNRVGYTIKGELFFSAFIKSWEEYLENNTNKLNITPVE